MYFVEHDINKLTKNHKVDNLIRDFQHSGLKCAKVEGTNYKDANVGYRSFWRALKRNKLTHIECHVKNNEIYLVNTLIK